MNDPRASQSCKSSGLIDHNFSKEVPANVGTVETSLKVGTGRVCIGSSQVEGKEDELYVLFRFNADGTQDKSFGTKGSTTGSYGLTKSLGYSVTKLKDDKLLTIGLTSSNSYFFDGVPALARFYENGNLDKGFRNEGHLIIERPKKLAQKPFAATLKDTMSKQQHAAMPVHCQLKPIGDKILVLANYFGSDTVLMMFDRDGNPDTRFNKVGYKELESSDDMWLHGLNLHVDDQAILVCARIYNSSGLEQGGRVISLDLSGEYSVGFGTAGAANFPADLKMVQNFLVQPNRIIGCGMGENRAGSLVALDRKGAVDKGFCSQLEHNYSLAWNQLVALSPGDAESQILAAGIWNKGPTAPILLGLFDDSGKLVEQFGDGGLGEISLGAISTAARRLEVEDNHKVLVHCMNADTSTKFHGTIIRCRIDA